MLAKYSIRAKIITVVAFLLVAMTGMGLLAVKNLRAINADTVEITTSYVFTPVAPLIPQSARTLTSTTRMIISR